VGGRGPSLLEVSGGFDSAVVAATAVRLAPGQRLSAFNLHGDRPEADERRWAEIICRQGGLEPCTASLDVPTLTAPDFDELAHGARPALNAIDLSRDRLTVEAAEATGAERLVTGKGGDAVFFQHPTAEILSDLVASRGWRGWCDPFAPRLARRLRRSVWSVGVEAFQALRRAVDDAPFSPLLGPRAWAIPPAAAHPWLEGIQDLPPARRYQLHGLVMTQIARGVTRYGGRLEVHHPLLSQPVMEAALRIPVWRLARDGRERGLARDLFADRVPREILARRSKGEMGAHFAKTVAANLAFLRPYLLDGCLCDAGVLDRRALEAALTPEALIQSTDSVLILSAAAMEAFVRYWQARAPDHPRNARSQP
jgi:asparagine synthase (glutamine-hydrolysing)